MAVPAFDPNQPFETLDFDPLAFVREVAAREGVDPDLAASVLMRESSGNAKARSKKGAYGYMQLMPGTARDLGVNRYDPYDNITGGVRYLKQQLEEFKDPAVAVAAYNAGPRRVRQFGGIPPIKETQDYVTAVLGAKAPPKFDPAKPVEPAEAAVAPEAPPEFDPSAPFEAIEPPKASFREKLAAAIQAAGQPIADEVNTVNRVIGGMVRDLPEAGRDFRQSVQERQDRAGEMIRAGREEYGQAQQIGPLASIEGLLNMAGGAWNYGMSVPSAALETIVGRPVETATGGEVKREWFGDYSDLVSGFFAPMPKGVKPGSLEGAKAAEAAAAREAATPPGALDELGRKFRGAVFGEQLDPLQPGPGSVVDAKTGEALTAGQTATYDRLRTSGGLDPNAPPGSQQFPRAQRAPEDLPPPGEWYVDVKGELKQSPPIATVPEIVVEAPQAPEGVQVADDLETPLTATPEALAEPPAFDPAQPFEPIDDFPGDRLRGDDETVLARRNVETIEKQLADERAAAERERRIVNTRGQGVQYHGARGPITKLEEGYYNPDNIYGGIETFYTTDAADIAKGYGRKSPNQAMYQVAEREPVNFYDMERPLSEADAKSLGILDDDLLGLAWDEATAGEKAPNLREVMDESRALSRGEGLSKDEVQERFDVIYQALQQQGFGGVQHIGGLKTNRDPHTVKIYLRPHEQIELRQVDPPLEPLAADRAQYFSEFEKGLEAARAKLAEVEGRAKQRRAKPAEAPDLTDRALDLIRGGKEVRQKRGPSLVDALTKQGGLRDEGGELTALDPRGSYGARGGRLVNKSKGMSLDDAAAWAQERGYIGRTSDLDAERVTPQDLLDAIRRDLDGDRVYAREDLDGAELSQHVDDLEEMLAELGIDASKASNAEIKQALNEYFSAPEGARDTIYGVKTPRAKSPDQPDLPGVEGFTDTKASIILELQRRSAKRAAEPMPEGSLFDEVRRGEQGLFDDKKPLGLREVEPQEPVARPGRARLQQAFALRQEPPEVLAASGNTTAGLPDMRRAGPVARADAAKPQPLPEGSRRVADMAARLRKTMGVTHRQGRFTLKGADAKGQYAPETGVVRTKDWDELDVASHEFGHDLDFRNLPRLRKAVDAHKSELIPLDYAFDPTKPARAEAAREGFAEFFRRYVTNPEAAKARAPGFYDAFEAALKADRPKMLGAIQKVAKDYDAYIKAPSADRLEGAVVSTADKGPVKNLLGRVKEDGAGKVFKDWLHGVYFSTQDSMHGLTRAEQGLQRAYFEKVGKPLDLEGKASFSNQARLMSNAAGDGFADLTEGVRMPGEVKPSGPSLQGALEKAYGKSWDPQTRRSFSAYLIARRLVNEWDRFAQGKLPKEPHRTTKDDALQAIAEYEQAHPGWKAAADEINTFNRAVLEKYRKAGLISQEAYDDALKEHPFYVPLNRDLKDRPRANSGAATDGGAEGGLKRFEGSTRDFIDPIESIMRRSITQAAVIRANEVKLALRDAARRVETAPRNRPAGDSPGPGFFVEEVPDKEIRAFNVAAEDALKATAKEAGVSLEDVLDTLRAADMEVDGDARLTLFKSEGTKPRGEPIVFFWEDGKRHALRLADGELGAQMYEALTTMGHEARNIVLDILAPTSRALQTGVTTHPAYFVANTIRDAWATTMNTPWGVNFIPFWTTLRGIVDDLGDTTTAKLYSRFGRVKGGAAMYAVDQAQYARDVQALRKRNILVERFSPWTRKGPNLAMVAHLAELSEAGTRHGVFRLAYKRALKDGLSPEDAAVRATTEAADILPFDRHGARMFTAHKAVVFLNAWQQGIDKALRTGLAPTAVKKLIRGEALTKADERALKGAAMKWWPLFGLPALVGLHQAASYFDDPEYQEISPYIRATHWVFRAEDIGMTAAFPDWAGRWVSIPKPFENAMLSNVAERGYEAKAGDKKAMDRMGSGLWELLGPPTGVPLLSVLGQQARNRDYNGKPIVPEHLKNVDPELQVNSYTSEFSRGMAKVVGDITEKVTGERKTFSPARADHWITGLLASWGRSFLTQSDRVAAVMKGEEPPALGPDEGLVTARFVRDPTRSSQSQAEFWKRVSTDEGTYERAFGTFSKLYKDDPDGAMERLAKLPEDARDYVMAKAFASSLMPGIPGGASTLHPMVRAREVLSVLSDIREEVREGKFADARGKPVRLTPDERRRADDALSHLGMAEMRDALILSGAKGYDDKAIMEIADDRDALREINPALVDLLDAKMKAESIPTQATVRERWPELRLRLDALTEAQTDRLMLRKRTRTKAGKYEELRRKNAAVLGE